MVKMFEMFEINKNGGPRAAVFYWAN